MFIHTHVGAPKVFAKFVTRKKKKWSAKLGSDRL